MKFILSMFHVKKGFYETEFQEYRMGTGST